MATSQALGLQRYITTLTALDEILNFLLYLFFKLITTISL